MGEASATAVREFLRLGFTTAAFQNAYIIKLGSHGSNQQLSDNLTRHIGEAITPAIVEVG